MRIGIAVGGENVTIARLDQPEAKPHVHIYRVPPVSRDEGWDHLVRVLRETGEAFPPSGRRGVQVYLTLLPPLVRVRTLTLPRLRDHELRMVLARDVGRYLIGVTVPQVIGYRRVGDPRRSPQPVLLAAAPEWLVDGLVRSVEAVGWEVAAIGPAHAAWAAAATSDGTLVVADDGSAEVIQVEDGELSDVRRVPLTPTLASTVVAPEETAARHAQAVRSFELVPAGIVEARTDWSRQLTRRLWIAAAALLLVTLGLARLDLARELAAIRSERQMIAAQVGGAMRDREVLENRRALLTALASAELQSARWTGVLGGLAGRLPEDAWLTGFRGQGDSLSLDGEAGDAGGVIAALQRADAFSGVQATAPIRQMAREDGESAGERFTLLVRLHRAATPTVIRDTDQGTP